MPAEVVVVGIGEMGGVLARGLLRDGCTVVPVTRQSVMAEVAARVSAPELVVVAVGEDALEAVLVGLPDRWRDRVVLLQNELLPVVWERRGIATPTVLVAWFEKKKGGDVTVIVPSPVWGPGAARVAAALGRVGIAAREVGTREEIVVELVTKNVYILVSNLAGMVLPEGTTVGALFGEHRELAEEVSREVLAVQEALVGAPLHRDRVRAGVMEAVAADPGHRAKGRTAAARLARVREQARERNVATPRLDSIAGGSR